MSNDKEDGFFLCLQSYEGQNCQRRGRKKGKYEIIEQKQALERFVPSKTEPNLDTSITAIHKKQRMSFCTNIEFKLRG